MLRTRTDLVAREVDDEVLILDRQGGKVHQLNATAAFIWGRLDGATPIDEVVAAMMRDFSVDAGTARHDVASTVQALKELGLLVTGNAGQRAVEIQTD